MPQSCEGAGPPRETSFVYAYCDGDTFVHISEPGPCADENRELVRILIYDDQGARAALYNGLS